MAKSFREKLAEVKPDLPRVQKIEPKQEKRWGKGTILMPTVQEVDELMKKVPKASSSPSIKSANTSPPNTGPLFRAQS